MPDEVDVEIIEDEVDVETTDEVNTEEDLSEKNDELNESETVEDTGSETVEEVQVEEKPALNKELQQEQQLRANAQRRAADLEAQLKAAKETKTDETDDDPLEAIAALKAKSKEYDDVIAQVKSNNERVAYSDYMAKLDKEFGSEMRNDAIAHARQVAINAGFTLQDGHIPDVATTCMLIKEGYMKAQIASLKKGGVKTVTKPVKGDNGRRASGGSVTGTKVTKGSPSEVIEAMKKEGKFKDYY